MTTVFEKMHGAGNDFVLLDLRQQTYPVDADSARQLADRHTGIGCDQVLVLRDPADPPDLVDFEVWNADGSRAEQCGNGVRCIGLYLTRRGEMPAGRGSIGGPAGRIQLEMTDSGQVRVDMGVPDFDPARIPVDELPQDGEYTLETELGTLRVGAVSMGNPHALMRVDSISDPDIDRLGPLISRHALFPNGCNAGFAEIVDRAHVRLRVFERGAGETRACGSGACAAAAILQKSGLVDGKIQILQEGGTLFIEWHGNHSRLMMTGPAALVYQGTLK